MFISEPNIDPALGKFPVLTYYSSNTTTVMLSVGINWCESQKAVPVYITSEQLLHSGFAEHTALEPGYPEM